MSPFLPDAELAEKLVREVRAGGVDLRVELDPEGGEMIRPVKLSASARELPPEVAGRLRQFRPHVLAYLKGKKSPAAATPDGLAMRVKPAPRVREPARVRDLIGRLPGDPDPASEEACGRAIAEALGDHKPESLALYLGLAGDVRRGVLAVGCLQEAFEEACGRRAKDRGRVFTAAVKRWLHSARSGATPPARRSP